MQLAIFSIVFTVVEFKEKGIMKRLFVAPLRPSDFTLSQVITRMIVTILQVAILIAVAVLIFDIQIVGNYFILLVLVILGSIMFLSMGFAIAGIAKTQDAAAPIANIISFPQMFLANVFFPIESMPEWLQGIVVYLPLNYLADGIRSVATEAATWSELTTDFIGLGVWIVISLILAFKLFRWQKAANDQ
jgi:ABC-2 type transport system permease protein